MSLTMSPKNEIPIVDLFAGPGGLGEGFSAHDRFRIIVSAEMDEHAHSTLRLRAFYRIAKRHANPDVLEAYYRFCNKGSALPDTGIIAEAWNEAEREAQRLTLGDPEDNQRLDNIITANSIGPTTPWVLIGGPPCQAYSLVGRARNRGKTDYVPEEDHRHFLYKEYLRIIQKYRPAVFVMENVKGIISSSINGERIFKTIMKDLVDPDQAIGKTSSGPKYRIHSLSYPVAFDHKTDHAAHDPLKYIVRAEDYGIPQARHRVFLLGIREDFKIDWSPNLQPVMPKSSVGLALRNLPPRRSQLSRGKDSPEAWLDTVKQHFIELQSAAHEQNQKSLADAFATHYGNLHGILSTGSLRSVKAIGDSPVDDLAAWYDDPNLRVWLNHEARGHMASDLLRYSYASSYAKLYEKSPKGHTGFSLLEKLRPSHANWESGKFADRFRVQHFDQPATTITSHISKDGHYFIHPDPTQCRSLTVREAARLQTFPDNYFFQGNRTQQFHQVGNAVPPLLAFKIAKIVLSVIDNTDEVRKALPAEQSMQPPHQFALM